MGAEHLNPVLRCGTCSGSGITYHDWDIGTVYCHRCDGSGHGVLIRWPRFVVKWVAILTAVAIALSAAAILVPRLFG